MAGNGLEPPWGWVADNVFHLSGSTAEDCFSGIRVESDGPPDDSPIMQDAREILGSIDIASLDTTAAEAAFRQEAADAIGPDGEPSPLVLTDVHVKQHAIDRIVAERVWSGLASKGCTEDEIGRIHIAGRSTACR